MAKKTNPPAPRADRAKETADPKIKTHPGKAETPGIRKIAAPTTAEGLDDSISRAERNDANEQITVPGRLSQWLNPRRGKSPLDPVLLAAREPKPKKAKGAYRRKRIDPITPTEVETGHDGLPKPRGGR